MMGDGDPSAITRIIDCVQSCSAPDEFRHQVLVEARLIVVCDGAVYGAGPHWRTAKPLYLGDQSRLVERFVAGAERYLPELERFCAVRKRGAPFIVGQLYTELERQRLAIYRELLTPLRIHSLLSCPFVFRGELVAQFLLWRNCRGPPFAQEEAERIAVLTPVVAVAEAGMQVLFGSRH
jgi:hypothetical protein